MNIIFLTTNYSLRTSGGIGSYIHTTGNWLVRAGHNVTVVSPVITKRYNGLYSLCRVESEVVASRRRLELSKIFYSKLIELNNEEPIDIVEATDWGMEAFDSRISNRFTVVVRLHTPNSVVDKLNGYSRLKDSCLVNESEAEYFLNAKYLSSPSIAMAQLTIDSYKVNKSSVKVINNPVDIFYELEGKPFVRNSDVTRICFLGRLEPRKGVYVFAESLKLIFDQIDNVECCFIGPDTRLKKGSTGNELRKILSQWSERVFFTGHLDGAEKLAAIENCDLVVLPSLWENFPYACLESLVLGKHVIATNGSGFDEIITPGINGTLVTPGDSLTLSKAVIEVLANKKHLVKIDNRNIIARFSADKIMPEIENYYKWVKKTCGH